MKFKIHFEYKHKASQIKDCIKNFDHSGKILVDGKRNQLRLFDLNGKIMTIKAFGVPNVINKIAYRYFRKSKAQRSFEYALRLRELGIGTPAPIAYAEDRSGYLFGRSFYACEYLEYDLEFRDLVHDPRYAGDIQILKDFTAFTFDMHEKGVCFLDHSPGNTLIVKKENGIHFYLVDLNRMEFKAMDFKSRMLNFARLTPKKEMVVRMGREYACLAGYDEQKTIDAMWRATEDFQEGFRQKKELKKKLRFWR